MTPRRAAPPHDPGIAAFIALRAKDRIRADVAAGAVPPVGRFEELHGHVDANMYLLNPRGDYDAALTAFAGLRGGRRPGRRAVDHQPPLQPRDAGRRRLARLAPVPRGPAPPLNAPAGAAVQAACA